MNKWLMLGAGIVAIIGLVINVTVDRDNIYDMTLVGLWLVTLILSFLGAFVGQRKDRAKLHQEQHLPVKGESSEIKQ